MRRIETINELRAAVRAARAGGGRVALVPTMGAFHEGHLTLIDDARARADITVVSLFVNPLQFAPTEDLSRYPRNLERDFALAEARDADILFTPSEHEMYGRGAEVRVTPGPTGSLWEGAVRPGHFEGVLTVVAKLFNIVQPDSASFGQKDIQQVVLIRQLIAQLDFAIELSVVPIAREPDGLAMSSRNVYLNETDRVRAVALSRSLRAASAAWHEGTRDATALQAIVTTALAESAGVVADYIAVADGDRMMPVERAETGTIVAVAARVGTTRLIDNTILGG